MGLVKKASIKLYWDIIQPCASTPWFVTHFNRDRFQLLLKFIHFTDISIPNQQQLNKTYKVQYLVEHFNKKILYYYPQRDISMDESMIDSTIGCLFQFEIYKGGKDPDEAAVAQAYNLGIDNCYTFPQLLLDLYLHQTTAIGTVRVNRKGLPEICLKTKLKNKEVCGYRKCTLFCVAYQDGKKKQPVLLSTVAKAGFTELRNRRGNLVMKPNAVAFYDRTMVGLDLGDAQLYVYLSERKTIKWNAKVAIFFI
ncbi:piggyBac transposable element-derived protein 4-like [Hydra vulgaris]|uniref:PiggyBac transposable element-derived protein 4-like n=1 Tax=Hydra vulgaris TaxID=6087 RepID=A0ABM4DCD1_HYDVU